MLYDTVVAFPAISAGTANQNPELQLQEIRDYGSRKVWEIADQDIASGAGWPPKPVLVPVDADLEFAVVMYST